MDAALLHGEEVNVMYELISHLQEGKSQLEVKVLLEDKYRNFSKKNAFKCLCCNSIVEIGLPRENRFYFRHQDKKDCSYSENYKTYTEQESKYERVAHHDLGKTLIRTFLEGQLKPMHIPVIDGYKYKSQLSIVPDLIIELPNGTKWALDFLTGIKKTVLIAKTFLEEKKYIRKMVLSHFSSLIQPGLLIIRK